MSDRPTTFPLPSRSRRMILTATVVGAFMLLAATAAWACVPWKGEMTVTPVDTAGNAIAGQNAVTVHGDGQPGMQWCPGESYSPAEAHQGDRIKIEVAPRSKTDQCAASQLGDGEYDVTLSNPGGFIDHNQDGEYSSDGVPTTYVRDCMYPLGMWSHHLGTLTVTSGSGSGIYALNDPTIIDDAPFEATGVCVTKQSTSEGNMAPLTIL